MLDNDYEDFALFNLRARGTLRSSQIIAPVLVHVEASLGKTAVVGRVYGPAHVLFDAFYNRDGVLRIAGIEISPRFCGYSAPEALAFFEIAPLYRALARAAAKRLASGE